jgi:hypothetical protein
MSRRWSHSRFDDGGEDPAAALVNLVDIMLVFICALIVALVAANPDSFHSRSQARDITRGKELESERSRQRHATTRTGLSRPQNRQIDIGGPLSQTLSELLTYPAAMLEHVTMLNTTHPGLLPVRFCHTTRLSLPHSQLLSKISVVIVESCAMNRLPWTAREQRDC